MLKSHTLLVIFSLSFLHSLGQKRSGASEFANVDTPAEYPGGLNAFYAYLKTNLVYPSDARQKAIEGRTYILFVVDESGYIIPGSVKNLKSLLPSCDTEAIRVIKLCKTQWKSALKNNKPVKQQFVLPVSFSLSNKPTDPLHPTEQPIQTVVVKKSAESKDSVAWTLYSDAATSIKSGTITVGDSVVVTGWAPWAYYIQKDTIEGYVSWKALMKTDELEHLSKIIAERSPEEYDEIAVDPPRPTVEANAYLSVTANKKNVYPGECFTVTLAFNVHFDNRLPIQFYDLGVQLSEILTSSMKPDNCYLSNSEINDIQGEETVIDGVNYTTYSIYKASYCPINSGTIVFPAINLKMSARDVTRYENDSTITFSSTPLSIKVNPLPSGMTPSLFDGYPLVGKFELTDSLQLNNITVNRPVSYKVTIQGDGLTFPINPPEINLPNTLVQLVDIIDTDSWSTGELYSRKTFMYQLTFERPGVYDFREIAAIRYFNWRTKKIEILKCQSRATVASYANDGPAFIRNSTTKSNFIALDVSQSMGVEDYVPNRLDAVKSGLRQFFVDRADCNIGVILFSGDATQLKLHPGDNCYREKLIDSIDFRSNKMGTAIGDAIWLAKSLFEKNPVQKKLVIIGDGDNNAGHISPKMAAALAKKYDITIYTIGVGTSGLVPFGRDTLGRQNLYPNTFSDHDLKAIASLTNGQYYWAKNAGEVTRFLNIIFSK